MTITIGSATFENIFYDAEVDVLYLNGDGHLVGVKIVGAKALLEDEGEIKITLPYVVHVASDIVAPALLPA